MDMCWSKDSCARGLGGSRAAGRELRWPKEPWIRRDVGGRGGSRIEGWGYCVDWEGSGVGRAGNWELWEGMECNTG